MKGLDRTRRDSAGSSEEEADGNQEIELRPVGTADAGDDEVVVHPAEEEGERRAPKKPKTLFGLPPIVMMKLY